MAEIISKPYRIGLACEKCVFGTGIHLIDCGIAVGWSFSAADMKHEEEAARLLYDYTLEITDDDINKATIELLDSYIHSQDRTSAR